MYQEMEKKVRKRKCDVTVSFFAIHVFVGFTWKILGLKIRESDKREL